MIAIPALDLRDGACAQLAPGVSAPAPAPTPALAGARGPVEVARAWERLGFTRLHLVDLDAARGRGTNAATLREVLASSESPVQAGGGVHETNDVDRLLEDGAAAVVVGTRAVEEPGWLAELAGANPGQIIVALDIRARRIVTHGWTRTLPRNVLDAVSLFGELPLAALLVTAIHRDGPAAGIDLFLMEDVAEESAHPIFAAGPISTLHDLRSLAERGVSAAVLGEPLYAGALDARAVAEEFNS